MCLFGSKAPAAAVPQVAPAPTREQVAAAAAKQAQDAALATGNVINLNRAKAAQRQGVFGAIKTTPMGDSTYGTSTVPVAKFGGYN